MLTGVLPYMEETDMTKSQIAAAKLKNMHVVLSLKMRQHSTKWYLEFCCCMSKKSLLPFPLK